MVTTIKALKTDLKVILFGVLITNIGNYMLNPFLALYLNTYKNLDASEIGIVLMCSVICMQGLTFFGGIITDSVGTKKLLMIGLIIRISGYIFYMVSNHIVMFVISSGLVGLGAALYYPATKAIIYTEAGKARKEVFALRSTVTNIGASVGPILGGILFRVSFKIVFTTTALIFFIYLCLVIIFINENYVTEKKTGNEALKKFKTVIKDKNLLILILISTGFWLLYNQFTLTIPLYAKDVINASDCIGMLFTLNGLLVVAFQYILIKKAGEKFLESTILQFGMAMMAAAFILLAILPYISTLFIFAFLFTLSEMLVVPTIDNITGNLAPPKTAASYYGFMLLGSGVGGALGNLFGGFTYEFLKNRQKLWIFWIALSVMAFLTAFLFRYFFSGESKAGININTSEEVSSIND